MASGELHWGIGGTGTAPKGEGPTPSENVFRKATRSSSSADVRPRFPSSSAFTLTVTSGAGQQFLPETGLGLSAQSPKTSRVPCPLKLANGLGHLCVGRVDGCFIFVEGRVGQIDSEEGFESDHVDWLFGETTKNGFLAFHGHFNGIDRGALSLQGQAVLSSVPG